MMECQEELLIQDFEQCFNQMRHHDMIFMQIFYYILAGYFATITGATALIGSNINKATSLLGTSILLFFVSISSTILIWTLMRNRIYYIYVSRYVNEIRNEYLKEEPIGFKNYTGIYTNSRKPYALSWGSLHLVVLYFISFLNAIGFALGIQFLRPTSYDIYSLNIYSLLITFSIFVLYLFIQITWIVKYLSKKDKNHSAEDAVFEN